MPVGAAGFLQAIPPQKGEWEPPGGAAHMQILERQIQERKAEAAQTFETNLSTWEQEQYARSKAREAQMRITRMGDIVGLRQSTAAYVEAERKRRVSTFEAGLSQWEKESREKGKAEIYAYAAAWGKFRFELGKAYGFATGEAQAIAIRAWQAEQKAAYDEWMATQEKAGAEEATWFVIDGKLEKVVAQDLVKDLINWGYVSSYDIVSRQVKSGGLDLGVMGEITSKPPIYYKKGTQFQTGKMILADVGTWGLKVETLFRAQQPLELETLYAVNPKDVKATAQAIYNISTPYTFPPEKPRLGLSEQLMQVKLPFNLQAIPAGLYAPYESFAFAVARFLGVETPRPPPTYVSGLIGDITGWATTGKPVLSEESQRAREYGYPYIVGTMFGDVMLALGMSWGMEKGYSGIKWVGEETGATPYLKEKLTPYYNVTFKPLSESLKSWAEEKVAPFKMVGSELNYHLGQPLREAWWTLKGAVYTEPKLSLEEWAVKSFGTLKPATISYMQLPIGAESFITETSAGVPRYAGWAKGIVGSIKPGIVDLPSSPMIDWAAWEMSLAPKTTGLMVARVPVEAVAKSGVLPVLFSRGLVGAGGSMFEIYSESLSFAGGKTAGFKWYVSPKESSVAGFNLLPYSVGEQMQFGFQKQALPTAKALLFNWEVPVKAVGKGMKPFLLAETVKAVAAIEPFTFKAAEPKTRQKATPITFTTQLPAVKVETEQRQTQKNIWAWQGQPYYKQSTELWAKMGQQAIEKLGQYPKPKQWSLGKQKVDFGQLTGVSFKARQPQAPFQLSGLKQLQVQVQKAGQTQIQRQRQITKQQSKLVVPDFRDVFQPHKTKKKQQKMPKGFKWQFRVHPVAEPEELLRMLRGGKTRR